MKTPVLLAALAAFCSPLLLTAQTVLLNENFNSYADVDAANAAGWYFRNINAAGNRYSITAFSNGSMTGNALRNGGGSAGNSWALKQWSGVSGTTLATGQTLTLSFDMYSTSNTGTFEVGLLFASNLLTQNSLGVTSEIGGATGYVYTQTASTSTAGVGTIVAGSGSGTAGNDVVTVKATPATTPTVFDSTVHSYSFSVSLLSTGAEVSFYQGGSLVASWLDTSVTAGSLSLNTLKLRTTNTTNIDNVTLTLTAVPEPSSAALAMGSAVLAAPLLFRRRRRR